jgi:hypothetical protein
MTALLILTAREAAETEAWLAWLAGVPMTWRSS